MKVLIIYFSQTNVTKIIAQKMAEAIESSGNKCQIKDFSETSPSEVLNADLVGCGTPVHAWHIPYIYNKYLEKLPSLIGKKAFVFVTYGDMYTANVLYDVALILRNKGAVVIGGFKAVGYHSLPLFRRKGKGFGRPDERDFQAARDFIKKLI